ncbi:phosphonate ABC transporter, permease protein PhnE [Roseateles sp. PN1]|uniref:phosphonate ABC transporter, permease protein PhnE n=1 Tax=Roseateles sp. PN1 TaxID=3137372 RepID=UPI0031394FDA
MNQALLTMPAALRRARRQAMLLVLALLVLVLASFWSLDLQWGQMFSAGSAQSMGRFVGEFFPPDLSPDFLRRVLWAGVETLAMSALGTLLAVLAGLVLALGAAHPPELAGQPSQWLRRPLRWLLNALRAIPELVWASLLLIAAGLGPMAGTLALAAHTSGVLGRLFADALENAPADSARALRNQGLGGLKVFCYASLPEVLPQLISYSLYRWENNIRAAAVLGVVGAGGLGQMLSFHLSLFQMGKTATLVGAMLILVLLVDAASDRLRKALA